MDKNRIANAALHGRVEGTTKRGRPKTTWVKAALSKYNEDPQVILRLAQDRDRWLLASNHVRAYVNVQN